jgi:quercetin dioxygenase-like cupin family protein
VQVTRSRPQSSRGQSDRFTGEVWIDPVAVAAPPSRLVSNSVHFSPGARTAWHAHPLGQVLHVLEGAGRVQARGGPVLEVRAGDTVVTPAGEWHWHGAAPGTLMTHLGMQEADSAHETVWGDHVTDAEYLAPPG